MVVATKQVNFRKMRSILLRVTVCLLFFCLTGCPKFAYVNMYNNTGTVITLLTEGEEPKIAPAEAYRFRLDRELVIDSKTEKWDYTKSDRMPMISKRPSIIEDGKIIKLDPLYVDSNDTIRVQINSNGLIYVLKHNEFPPKSNFETQPIGYPLSPSKLTK
jgi:hypothetical protein